MVLCRLFSTWRSASTVAPGVRVGSTTCNTSVSHNKVHILAVQWPCRVSLETHNTLILSAKTEICALMACPRSICWMHSRARQGQVRCLQNVHIKPGCLFFGMLEEAHLNSCLSARDGSGQAMHVALHCSVKAPERAQALRLLAALPQALHDRGVQPRIRPSTRLYHLLEHLQARSSPRLCLQVLEVSLHSTKY